MKSDVVVVGAELDALVASLKLARRGAHVRLLMPGSSSLHYATGGIGVLGTIDGQPLSQSPFRAIGQLPDAHPYKLIGEARVRGYLDEFLSDTEDAGWRCSGRNEPSLTMGAGIIPVYARPALSGLLSDVQHRRAVIVGLEGLQDFTPNLCAAGLARRDIRTEIISIEAPARGDSARSARQLDRDASQWLQKLAKSVPSQCDVIVLPAILGLDRHVELRTALERLTQRLVIEVPTLPPSVPGMRLMRRLLKALSTVKVDIHHDVRGLQAEIVGERCLGMSDAKSQRYQAAHFISASGGVLMGGLDVTSAGRVVDPVFGLDVEQTSPLGAASPGEVVSALQTTGIATDRELRPSCAGTRIANVLITGRQLPAWQPNREHSLEGVAIATASRAAELIAIEGRAA